MPNLAYEMIERKQRIQIKSYALLCVVLLISVGIYSFTKWQDYSLAKEGILENNKYVEIIKVKAAEEKDNYENEKPVFNQINKEVSKNLKTIFPIEDDYKNLTRQFDSFETKLSKKNSMFEISNIEYQDPGVVEAYSVLPVRMTIRSSRENFTKFLHYIENSGALNGDVRLMDIVSIRINFEDSQEESVKAKIVNFSVQINAYFQKSA